MEFDTVGKHCQVHGCGQKDFLPFTCDCCRKVYCLEHRTYTAHVCSGSGIKDMTSIDCPICGKAVKFDTSQDVNMIWDDHYLNLCSQKPADKRTTVKRICCKKSCNTVLGVSNWLKCPKCSKEVCLAHKIAIDHDCTSLSQNQGVTAGRNALLDRIDNNNSKSKAVTATKAIQRAPSTAKTTPSVTQDNTLKGSAERRKLQQNGTQTRQNSASSAPINNITANNNNKRPADTQSEILVCPFCDFLECTGKASILQAHVASQHSDPPPTASTNRNAPVVDLTGFAPPVTHSNYPAHNNNNQSGNRNGSVASSGGGGGGREVCPQCQARFSDPIALVTHFETAHSSGAAPKSDCQIS